MGQKTHPYGFRLGVIKPWRSNWYAEKDFSELLKEDLMLRRYVRQRLQRAGVSQINIERQQVSRMDKKSGVIKDDEEDDTKEKKVANKE